MARNVKKRNWAFVLYPESAPENWREQLTQTGLQCAVSPLHDSDTEPTGEKKKAHYHIILCYAGPTTFGVVKKLTDSLNQPIPQPLEQVKGYYRYFTHKDNPEKFQYSESDITTINGFDIGDYVALTVSEIKKYKREITDIIYDKDITEYTDLIALLHFSDDDHMRELEDVANSHTIFFNTLVRSRRHKKEIRENTN